MAIRNLLAQVALDADSALPEDKIVNTWSFATFGASDPTAEAAIVSALGTFYTSMGTYLSGNLAGTATVRLYDRADATPRVPVEQTVINFTPGTAAALPDEVAACLSFHAAYQSGIPSARLRGRIFLGPLGGNAGGNGFAANRPVAAFLTALSNAGNALMTASAADADWNWNVWSDVDSLGRPVVGGWVDNAFDTMRSRGVAPTSRTQFGVN